MIYIKTFLLFIVADIPVRTLEKKVAAFDLEDAEFYQDRYDLYTVSFYIPEGKILAAYDKDGKILRTVERFKDVKLPAQVQQAIGKEYPGWGFIKDWYAVNYYEALGITKKTYKIKLKKRGKVVRLELDENGHFI